MAHLGVNLKQAFNGSTLELYHESDIDHFHPFLKHFKHMWADNGDMISKHYSGTGSTHSAAVKAGKDNIATFVKGKSVTVRRFFKANWYDTRR